MFVRQARLEEQQPQTGIHDIFLHEILQPGLFYEQTGALGDIKSSDCATSHKVATQNQMSLSRLALSLRAWTMSFNLLQARASVLRLKLEYSVLLNANHLPWLQRNFVEPSKS